MNVCKAPWHGDAQCAAVLTIDDLSYGYLDPTGRGVQPFTDWGYGCRRPGSIFHYFETQFLARFPEVRYTVFVPCGAHSALLAETGYPRHAGGVFENPEFGELLQHIVATGNEIAYHGHHHGLQTPTAAPETWLDEDREHPVEQYCALVAGDVERMRREYGIAVRGGRSPGYHNGPGIMAAATSGLFRWWSFDYTPYECAYGYRRDVFAFPTNVSGGALQRRPGRWRDWLRVLRIERRVGALVARGAVVNVTEHFMQVRADGKRQTPNVFSDVHLLEHLFLLLRGADVWYATCSEIARYRESYDHTDVVPRDADTFALVYHGSWDEPRLSLAANRPQLEDVGTGEVRRGRWKAGRWVIPEVPPATYRLRAGDAGAGRPGPAGGHGGGA